MGEYMTFKQRDKVSQEFGAMMARGIIPTFEVEFNNARIEAQIARDGYGVYFTFEIYANGDNENIFDNVKPYFDGEIQKRKNAFYCTWANIDRWGYSLDNVLHLFYDNLQDGFSHALN